jgi:hypothetical protein
MIWRTVGGKATPTARRARLAAGRDAERTTKRLPSCSMVVSVRARISGPGADLAPGGDALIELDLQQ